MAYTTSGMICFHPFPALESAPAPPTAREGYSMPPSDFLWQPHQCFIPRCHCGCVLAAWGGLGGSGTGVCLAPASGSGLQHVVLEVGRADVVACGHMSSGQQIRTLSGKAALRPCVAMLAPPDRRCACLSRQLHAYSTLIVRQPSPACSELRTRRAVAAAVHGPGTEARDAGAVGGAPAAHLRRALPHHLPALSRV